MENNNLPKNRKITRRKMLGTVGAAGAAAALAACTSQPVSTATPTPVLLAPTDTETPGHAPTSQVSGLTPEPPNLDSQDLLHYQRAWEALAGVLQRMDIRYRELPYDTRFPETRDTLMYIIRRLLQFASGQFYFFYNGFKSNENRPNGYRYLQSSLDFPRQQVLANTLAQISEDISIIRLIADQRAFEFMINPPPKPTQTPPQKTPEYRFPPPQPPTVQKSQDLVKAALWPGLESEDPSKDGFQIIGVITYLKKSIDVRVIPYARIALIGIPFASVGAFQTTDGITDNTGSMKLSAESDNSLGDWRTFLSIPHEVGHFHYWYSRHNDHYNFVSIREKDFQYIDEDYDHWGEEIFADIYAILVAGPLAIISGMDLALEHSATEFSDFKTKDEHPTPLIRPVIMIKALANLNKFKPNVVANPSDWLRAKANELLTIWKKRIGEGNVSFAEMNFTDLSWDIELNDELGIEKRIKRYIETIPTFVKNQQDWGWGGLLLSKIPIPSDLESYQDILGLPFAAPNPPFGLNGPKAVDWAQEPDPEDDSVLKVWAQEPDPDKPSVWKDWVEKKHYLQDDTLHMDKPLDAGNFPDDMKPTTQDKWIRIYGAAGWTTDGPCTTRR